MAGASMLLHLPYLLVLGTLHLTSGRSLVRLDPAAALTPGTMDSPLYDWSRPTGISHRLQPPWSFLDYTSVPQGSLSLSPPQQHHQLLSSGSSRSSSSRDKRLMGIFRCDGWGPGCSQMHRPVHSRKPTSNSLVHRRRRPLSSRNNYSRSRYGGYGGGYQNKFEPFFALTSGGSWGPNGKRSAPSLLPEDTDDVKAWNQQPLDTNRLWNDILAGYEV